MFLRLLRTPYFLSRTHLLAPVREVLANDMGDGIRLAFLYRLNNSAMFSDELFEIA